MSARDPRTWRIRPELMARLTADASLFRRFRLPAGCELYRQGDVSTKLFLVLEGLVQVSMLREDGTEVLLELMGPQTVCGEGAALDGLPRFSGARVLEPGVFLEFDAGDIPRIARENPEFVEGLLHVTALKQRVLALRLEQLSSRDPESRILEMFRRLAQVFAEERGPDRRVVPHLTHEQIAAMTGTTRVTVTRAMARLRARGDLEVRDGRILLNDTDPDA